MQSSVKQTHYQNIACLLSWGVCDRAPPALEALAFSAQAKGKLLTDAAKAKSVARAVAQVQAETLLLSPRPAQRYLMLWGGAGGGMRSSRGTKSCSCQELQAMLSVWLGTYRGTQKLT